MADQAKAKDMKDDKQNGHGAEPHINASEAHEKKQEEGREDSSQKMVDHCWNIGYGGRQWHKRRVDHLSAYHPDPRLKP